MKGLFSVGDLCVDVLQSVSSRPAFGEEAKLRALDFSIGGNAANFAVMASGLGLRPALISAIGRDFAAPFLRDALSRAKVKQELIKSRAKNAFSIISVNRRGERAIQSMKNSLNDITAANVSRVLLPMLGKNSIVFFGGFYHLKKFRNSFLPLLKRVKEKGATVCFDTCFDTEGKWSIDRLLPFINYLFVNDLELKHLAGGKTILQRVDVLFRKGSQCVVVKQAGKGATLFMSCCARKHFPSVAKKVVDTTGAGDAFNAGFVFGLMHGFSLEQCVIAGNFVAAHKIRRHGLAVPSQRELREFVLKRAKL